MKLHILPHNSIVGGVWFCFNVCRIHCFNINFYPTLRFGLLLWSAYAYVHALRLFVFSKLLSCWRKTCDLFRKASDCWTRSNFRAIYTNYSWSDPFVRTCLIFSVCYGLKALARNALNWKICSFMHVRIVFETEIQFEWKTHNQRKREKARSKLIGHRNWYGVASCTNTTHELSVKSKGSLNHQITEQMQLFWNFFLKCCRWHRESGVLVWKLHRILLTPVIAPSRRTQDEMTINMAVNYELYCCLNSIPPHHLLIVSVLANVINVLLTDEKRRKGEVKRAVNDNANVIVYIGTDWDKQTEPFSFRFHPYSGFRSSYAIVLLGRRFFFCLFVSRQWILDNKRFLILIFHFLPNNNYRYVCTSAYLALAAIHDCHGNGINAT